MAVPDGARRSSSAPQHVDQLREYLKKHDLLENVRILGLLPRAEQVQLMRRSVAIVQPSLFEGWSSLVEDARALGKRIYVSDIPVHREQDPQQASFFAPREPESLAELIARDWEKFEPGPDSSQERQASEENRHRSREFALSFLGLVERTLQAAAQ